MPIVSHTKHFVEKSAIVFSSAWRRIQESRPTGSTTRSYTAFGRPRNVTEIQSRISSFRINGTLGRFIERYARSPAALSFAQDLRRPAFVRPRPINETEETSAFMPFGGKQHTGSGGFAPFGSGGSGFSGGFFGGSGGSDPFGGGLFGGLFDKMLEWCSVFHAHKVARQMGIELRNIKFTFGPDKEVFVQVDAPGATAAQITALGAKVQEECPVARYRKSKMQKNQQESMKWVRLPPR